MSMINGYLQQFEVMFVDDDRRILSIVEEYLSRQGYLVSVFDNGLNALEEIKEKTFDIVFTDLRMPKIGGLELLSAIREKSPNTEVIVVTGHATVESAIEAMRLGSYDYVQKPFKLERIKILIDRIIEKRKLQNENILLKSRLKERYRYDELIGVSPEMQEIYEIIDRISENSPTVLIQGESGTGKEILAKVIHRNSDRSNKPFISINCGAIVDGLLESELFGHVKGAFTGAYRDKVGLFKAAEGGTLFLDEIAEINPFLQVKLLRALQERKIRPVGDVKEVDVDVRVIAATNRDVKNAVESGELRKDLFYRLNVVSIKMPVLNGRQGDIPLLVKYFLDKFNKKGQRPVKSVSSEAMGALLNYHWPGNVRELENVIERAFALGTGEIIKLSDLPLEIQKSAGISQSEGMSYSLRENEVILIKNALNKAGGDKAQAARLLEIDVSTLYRKIKKYRIPDVSLKIPLQ